LQTYADENDTIDLASGMEEEGVGWLLELLQQVQLEQFFVRLKDDLQVSRLQHFDYVQPEDLEKIGMSKPAAKRLLDLVKRRRLRSRITRFLPVGRFSSIKKSASSGAALGGSSFVSDAHGLTCLVQVMGLLNFRYFP
jgi:activated CDC42 kinase 1